METELYCKNLVISSRGTVGILSMQPDSDEASATLYPRQGVGKPGATTPVGVLLDDWCVTQNLDEPFLVLDLGDLDASEEVHCRLHVGQGNLFEDPTRDGEVFDVVAHTRNLLMDFSERNVNESANCPSPELEVGLQIICVVLSLSRRSPNSESKLLRTDLLSWEKAGFLVN